MRLVADVGGTNSRLALCDQGTLLPQTQRNYSNDDWTSLYAVVSDFLSKQSDSELDGMVIAMAGPVDGHKARLTNRDWAVDGDQLIREFNCGRVALLNDLAALGYSVPYLKADQVTTVKPSDTSISGTRQSVVVGIGTGLNVSPVVAHGSAVIALTAEAGHTSTPSSVAKLLVASNMSCDEFPTSEHLFSGRGLSRFCQLVSGDPKTDGKTAVAQYGDTATATRAIDLYAEMFGAYLHDVCLAHAPSAGIYLAGSVARAIADKSPSQICKVLNQPCAISYVKDVPLFTIEEDGAALLGCAGYSFQD